MQDSMMDKLKGAAIRLWDETVLGSTSDVGSQPASVAAANEVTSLYGLHSILKYGQHDPDTGLFYNDNLMALCLEVVAQTGADDDIVSCLNMLFTPVSPHYGVQQCLFGSPMLDDQFQAYMDQHHITVGNGKITSFFRELAKRRAEYIYETKDKPLWPNDNYVVKDIRLLFSITKAGSFRDAKLVEETYGPRGTVYASLHIASLSSLPFDVDGLISFLRPILNPESMLSKEPFPGLHYDNGKSIKNQVAASGQHVRVKTSELLFSPPPEKQGDEDRRIAVHGFDVLQYPQEKELWEMVNIIGSFLDDGLQYPCPFLVCGGVFTLDLNVVNGKAQIKAAHIKQNAKSKMAEFQPELQVQADDWDTVLHQPNNGGSMCGPCHTLLLLALKRVINRASQVALNVWRNERFMIYPLQLLQPTALYSSLPVTLTETVRDDLQKLHFITPKTTVNTVDMTLVIGEWKGVGDPVMMFFGRRGTPIFLDFYNNQQGNYNVFVAGVPGSGKSMTMNEVVSVYRDIGTRVWMINMGRSYQNPIRLQKGTFSKFTPSTKLYINPLIWVSIDDELDFKVEMRMLKPMIGRIASPNASLTEFQYALIGEAIATVWQDYEQDTNPTRICDYLLSNIKDESGSTERVAYELAKQFASFTKDGAHGDFSNGCVNISLNADMVGLELEGLRNVLELRRAMLFVLASCTAHNMYLTRDHKKLRLVDEVWQLLGADKGIAEFTEGGYRRARKYNGIFCVGTQGIEDVYKDDAVQAAYNNADQKTLLCQDRKNLEKLVEDGMVSFSPAVKRVLLLLRTECGHLSEVLISSPNGDLVVRHTPDPLSLLMTSTNAQDFGECDALLEQGHSIMETPEIMLAHRAPREQLSPRRRKDDY